MHAGFILRLLTVDLCALCVDLIIKQCRGNIAGTEFNTLLKQNITFKSGQPLDINWDSH